MSVTDQLLPTISALVALGEFATDSHFDSSANDLPIDTATVSDSLPSLAKQKQAQQAWQAAVAALGHLLAQQNQQGTKRKSTQQNSKFNRRDRRWSPQALILAGPVPLLTELESLQQLSNWTFVPRSAEQFASSFDALSPVGPVGRFFQKKMQKHPSTRLLPLLEDDPLAQEQFALVFTSQFALVLVLGKDADDELRFQFSFMPQVVDSVWRVLRSRIRLTRPQQLDFIDPLVEKFPPQDPHYRIVSQFNRWMIASLPPIESQQSQSQLDNSSDRPTAEAKKDLANVGANEFSDSELLKAMAHEIRTPLTTIRTYTRSLLRRQDLDPQVTKRLKSIDQECTQQIDRFSLIFRAVELEAASQSPKSPLSAIALHQVFQEAIPQWQQAARRRNLSLAVGLPPELPMVASDPTMLQHVLTGLVELFTHSVSPGSHIQLHVLHAGEQLKLQFQSQADPNQPCSSKSCTPPPLQSLGHLLMFQPDTGGLSLNLEATKNLFHALGAKLTVRERSNQGTTWTVFLPLEASGLKSYPIV
ncbi:MAG: HAMP domain-containing sensor histidine kinase [Phormidesmis sp.]